MNYTELIRVLYALLALSLSDDAIPEADEILTSTSAREAKNALPSLKDVMKEYIKGNEVDLTGIGVDLKDVIKSAMRDPKAKAAWIDILKAFGLWFRVGSERSLQKLSKAGVELHMPWLNRLFAKEVGSQKTVEKSLAKLIKSVTRRSALTFSDEEALALKAKSPVIYKEYLRLRREYNQVWKDALATFVRRSGKNLVPFTQAMRFLQKKGIEHTLPEGFTGLIDANGVWYTEDGKKINGIPSSRIFPRIRMNPDPEKDNYVFTAIREDGGRQHFYTVEFRTGQSARKFKIARTLGKNIDRIRKKWSPLIKNFDESDPRCSASLIMEMLYVYSARIGGKGNKTDGKATYGISTLRVNQCRWLSDGGLKIKYPGKKGVMTEHVLRPTTVPNKIRLKAFEFLLEDKARDDFVFTYRLKNGARKPVGGQFVNQLFKTFGAGEATLHKLRTLIATSMMEEALNELYAKKGSYNDPKRFLADLQKIALKVGKTLNHMRTTKEGTEVTGATAIQSYIDPALIAEAYEHYQIARPNWLERLMAQG